MRMMPTVDEFEVEANGIRFAICAWGDEGKPPLFALHGWLDNAASFHFLAPLLEGYRVLAVDLAGHGRSGHRAEGVAYNIWDNVADLVAIANVLGLERFSLLGHSMGGIICTLLAGSFPDRIERLMLIDGIWPMVTASSDAPAQLAKAVRGMEEVGQKRKTLYPTIEEAIGARMNGLNPLSREAASVITIRGLEAVSGGYQWRSDLRLRLPSMMRLTWNHARAFVASITAPTCLILAEQGIYLKREEFVRSQELLQRFSIFQLAGGHHLHMEAEVTSVAERFNQFSAGA
ncbi:alpha/beta fold hydrolase [Aestuariirhabdus litorea]|uniref:Alpha/beta hydrolase n=1 Tax=Aestuariirhabdus litorea TaxID=2528527 RepID=A0A3P3VQP2_9GAMM|nr:alpha/beta hydrolase [Aestuariirhabdus litorea]RRJ84940.1 alpha/beta hydrolase [Aestuariirhabdus litorea]RWW98165.1 alpha/beta fold hydrolase [Endozoicomonadaceae bacterium GTF-13]